MCGNDYLPSARRTIDAQGRYILPGLVDPHVHLGTHYPFDECAWTESRAAAAGGVTTMGLFLRHKEGVFAAFPEYKRGYEENAIIDAFIHAMVMDEVGLADIEKLPNLGITSFKFLLGYKGPQAEKYGMRPIDDGLFYEGMERIKKLGAGALALVHAENIDIALALGKKLRQEGRRDAVAWNDSRPPFCEEESVSRCIYLAGVAGCPLYIVHLTIAQGVEIAATARASGAKLVVETCPQYLTHNSEEPVPMMVENAALANVNPPLRDKKSNLRLWQGIKEGVIDCLGSDHAPIKLEKKGKDIWEAPMGLGNLTEMILPVMLSEGVNKRRLSLEKVVEVCCQNPARVFGLYPRKGAIAAGSDADLVIIDLDKKVRLSMGQLHSLSDWSIYDGWEFKGWPVLTMRRGQVIVEEGEVIGKRGTGKYLPRGT